MSAGAENSSPICVFPAETQRRRDKRREGKDDCKTRSLRFPQRLCVSAGKECLRVLRTLLRSVFSPQRRRGAEISAEKARTTAKRVLCAFLSVFASLRGMNVCGC